MLLHGVGLRHLLVDAHDCRAALLDDAGWLQSLFVRAAGALEQELLGAHFHVFAPQGVAGIVLLSAAHVSVHTWPEHAYAAIDLLGPAGEQTRAALDSIQRGLRSRCFQVSEVDRSLADGAAR